MLFSQDIGIDLGTANTLVFVKGKGIVIREPSVVAVDVSAYPQKVVAVGNKAKQMIGRTPGSITAVRPLKDGVIADFEITSDMLKEFIKMAISSSPFSKARVLICIPSGVTEVERKAVHDAARSAGAKYVSLIEEPMAAAIGAGLPVSEAIGNMVVDIGGGKVIADIRSGSLKGKSRTYYGFSWANQPVIEQWARRVRQDMPLLDGKNDKTALKEVIAASLDGKIYFLDLEDGSKTREPIELGYPMRSTPSLSTLAYPQMSVGQYARFLANKTGSIGQHFYDLLTNKENLTIDGLDGGSKKDRAYNDVGAFDGSALYDRNSDTYITAGTNGMLYTVHMNTVYETPTDESGNLKVSPTITMMKSRTKKQKDAYTAVEAPIAMYGSYVFYADVEGVLRCVDTTTMTTIWAVETGGAVKSAVALDFDDDGRLWLYTANTLLNRSKGDVTIRRYDATTGAEDWSLALNATKKKDYTAGAMASPVIGQYQLGDLVYYTLSYISASGSEKLLGSGAKAQEGVLVALNKQTGKVVWAKSLGGYCYSSPVAVYNENGKGWIIQATSDGVLMLLDGLTGETINTLQLNGTIEASPAVYQNMLLIGTTGKGTSFLYGVKID